MLDVFKLLDILSYTCRNMRDFVRSYSHPEREQQIEFELLIPIWVISPSEFGVDRRRTEKKVKIGACPRFPEAYYHYIISYRCTEGHPKLVSETNLDRVQPKTDQFGPISPERARAT